MGIGTDIIEVARIEKSIASERFLKEVYTEKEIELIKEKGAETAAVNFAAKEAFSKALGTGVRGFRLSEVEILRDSLGKPYINLYGAAARIAGNTEIEVSLSHTKEYAVSFVIIKGEKKDA